MRLGLFHPPTAVAYNTLTNDTSVILSDAHVATTRALAGASAVLLQHRARVLPLDARALASLALIGPAIDDGAVQLGDYADMIAPAVSIAAAAAAALPGVPLAVARGCANTACNSSAGFGAAAAAAASASAVVLQLGLCSDACNGQDGNDAQEREGTDRGSLTLPGQQAALAAAVRAAARSSTPIYCILFHGGAVDVSAVVGACDAILSFGYPGMQGGPAVFDVLLGTVAPAGRTALTWYTAAQAARLAPPGDYNMYSQAGLGRTCEDAFWLGLDSSVRRAARRSTVWGEGRRWAGRTFNLAHWHADRASCSERVKVCAPLAAQRYRPVRQSLTLAAAWPSLVSILYRVLLTRIAVALARCYRDARILGQYSKAVLHIDCARPPRPPPSSLPFKLA